MNPRSAPAAPTYKRMWAVLCIFVALLVFMKAMSAPSEAQSEERVLRAEIPEHLPVRVRLAKAQEPGFKRLDNERWLRDFALEVTNTGDKPIFYLYLLVRLPETKTPSGTALLYPLYYGRSELSDIEIEAKPDDIPIKPGETHLFTVHRGQVMAWEKSVREKNRAQPKLIELAFQKLSFGDRSGYGGPDGQKVPQSGTAGSVNVR